MRYHLFIATLILVLAAPMISAQAEPFVQDGRIVATIVVGPEAPQDVILGAGIASYLQTFADEVETGLARTSDEVDLGDGVQILIGMPENNPLVVEALGADDARDITFSGPYVRMHGDALIISGDTQERVSTAATAFRQGADRLGSVDIDESGLPEVPRQDDDDDGSDTTDGSDAANGSDRMQDAMRNPPAAPDTGQPDFVRELDDAPSCEPEEFCRDGALYARNADCSEQAIEYCERGCTDGSCQTSLVTRFMQGLFDAVLFWR